MESEETNGEKWIQSVEQNYARILQPVFTCAGQTSWFQLACALLRVSGVTLGTWDALRESKALLADFSNLTRIDLPVDLFPNSDATRWRLMLQSYLHVIEMDAMYHILANLLRVQNGLPYSYDPFYDLSRPRKNAKLGEIGPPLTPTKKIMRIGELAGSRFPAVATVFNDFYFSSLRNSIAHSDYVLDSDKLKMLHGRIASPNGDTPFVPYDRLARIIDTAGCFYRVFFELERRVRSEFAQFSEEELPFGDGKIAFIVDDDKLMCGFRVRWPSGGICEYREGPLGRLPMNMRLTENGVEFVDNAQQ
jgi:hypothetical protein